MIVIEVIGVSGLLLLTLFFYVLNDSLKANNKNFYFDYKNGKYGFNTSSTRGADTFVPFNSSGGSFKNVHDYMRLHENSAYNYTYTVPKGTSQVIVFMNNVTKINSATIPQNYYLSVSDAWGQILLFYKTNGGEVMNFSIGGLNENVNVRLSIFVNNQS